MKIGDLPEKTQMLIFSSYYRFARQSLSTILKRGYSNAESEIATFLLNLDINCRLQADVDSWHQVPKIRFSNIFRGIYTTALHLICETNILEEIQNLVKGGADVNALDSTHVTPIMLCLRKGYTQAIQILVDAGADLSQSVGREGVKMTPLDFYLNSYMYQEVETNIMHNFNLQLKYGISMDSVLQPLIQGIYLQTLGTCFEDRTVIQSKLPINFPLVLSDLVIQYLKMDPSCFTTLFRSDITEKFWMKEILPAGRKLYQERFAQAKAAKTIEDLSRSVQELSIQLAVLNRKKDIENTNPLVPNAQASVNSAHIQALYEEMASLKVQLNVQNSNYSEQVENLKIEFLNNKNEADRQHKQNCEITNKILNENIELRSTLITISKYSIRSPNVIKTREQLNKALAASNKDKSLITKSSMLNGSTNSAAKKPNARPLSAGVQKSLSASNTVSQGNGKISEKIRK